MNNLEFLLLSYISNFAILNPFSVVPAFLAMTRDDSVRERMEMARRGSIVAGIILLIIAMTGKWVFQMLGITLPALQIAGGIILFAIGFDMLRSPEAPRRLNDAESDLAQDKDDIAITPRSLSSMGLGRCLLLRLRRDTSAHHPATVAAKARAKRGEPQLFGRLGMTQDLLQHHKHARATDITVAS